MISKIDQLVESTARIEEHCKAMHARLDNHSERMERIAVRVTSLEETRTFAKGMIKLASVLSVTSPAVGIAFIKAWKFMQSKHLIP